jgi:hypothetical protein
MSGPFTLRIVRPYSSRDDYLSGDSWTVERSEMLLVGVEGVAPGASVNFEIALENREIVVRGEGRAMEIVATREGRPGGVRVRFKQLDPDSKATLRRALETQRRQAAEKRAEADKLLAAAQAEAVRAETEHEEPSSVHHRLAGPVNAPENRDALLERLRERARLRKTVELPPKNTVAAE